MKESGILLSNIDKPDSPPLTTSISTPSIVGTLNITNSKYVRLLKFPTLEWREPLWIDNLDDTKSITDGPLEHFKRSEFLLSKLRKCTSLPTWNYIGTYKKCINKISIIQVESDELCRITAECSTYILDNYNSEISEFNEESKTALIIQGKHAYYFQTNCKSKIACVGTTLYVDCSCKVIKAILTTGNYYNWFDFEESDNENLEIKLPYSIIKGGLQPVLTLYGKHGIIAMEPTTCDPVNVCMQFKCFLCRDKMKNLICLSQAERITLTVVILISASLILAILFSIIKRAYKLNVMSKNYLRNKLTSLKSRNMIKPKNNSEEQSDDLNSLIVEEVYDKGNINKSNHIEKPFIRRKLERNQTLYVFMVFICVSPTLFPIIRACSDSTTLTAEQKECISDSLETKVCKITSSVRVSGPPAGQSTCINIIDNDKNLKGYVSIKVLANNYHCTKSTLYKTVQAKIIPKTMAQCPGTGYCSSWEECSRFLSNRDLQHELFPNTINKLSDFECATPGGCAGNGCMRCDNGCVFSSIEFVRADTITYDVFECPSWTPHLSIEVKYHNLPGMDDFEATLTGSEPVETENIRIAKIADSVPVNVNDFCLLRTSKDIYYSKCQKGSELMTGSIGEIRCPSIKDAEALTDKCTKAKNIVKVDKVNWDIIYKNNQINISAAIKDYKLPKLHGQAIIDSLPDGTVLMRNTAFETYEIQVNFKKMEVSIRKEKKKCFGDKITIEGCFSCMSGATLKANLRASHQDTLGLISCTGLNPIPINIDTISRDYNISVFIQTKISGYDCILKCSGGTVALQADVNLEEQQMMNVEQSIISVSKDNSSHSLIPKLNFNPWLVVPSFSLTSFAILIIVIIVCIKCFHKPAVGSIIPLTVTRKYD